MIRNIVLILFFGLFILSCKKDKLKTDSDAKLTFSTDTVFFDTVFTTLGSSTRNFRVINPYANKLKISSIRFESGNSSQFIVNVDGAQGKEFKDIEIAAKDSMYIFIQVNVNPQNPNTPFIIRDKLIFEINGNTQIVNLEAWGQNAYYHRPTSAIKFKDGTYLSYSIIGELSNAVTGSGNNFTLKTDKPHVVFGYLVVDSAQKLMVPAGAKFYMSYKAGLWVYSDGEIKIKGTLGNEVTFNSARTEPEYYNEPGQWDRIWINEGSTGNEIDYAIIKNGFVGVQAELTSNTGTLTLSKPRKLKITNTQIHNMSLWGLYSFAYNIYSYNNVISNCKDNGLNISFGGNYTFLHCTFANYFDKGDKPRTTPNININNYYEDLVLPMDSCYFGNCIIDGKLDNEINIDLKSNTSYTPNLQFSNSWLKTTINLSDVSRFIDIRTGNSITYIAKESFNFKPQTGQNNFLKNFIGSKALLDVIKVPQDLLGTNRNSSLVTVGAYEF